MKKKPLNIQVRSGWRAHRTSCQAQPKREGIDEKNGEDNEWIVGLFGER
jgi:hypothetical protein